MAKASCPILQYLPLPTKDQELYYTFISNCVINSFLSYTATMMNIVTIHAMRKTSLPKPLKSLLLSLAVSDLGVGLLVQPFYICLLIKRLQQNISSCHVYNVFSMIVSLFFTASFLGVVAISVDRFLAIHLHLRYQELVTHKRAVAVVISIWLFSVLLMIMPFWLPTGITAIILASVGVACLLVSATVYARIYLVVQRHKNQMVALQMQQVQQGAENEDMVNFASIRKSAVCVFYIYLVFMLCYVPRFIFLVAAKILDPSIALNRFSVYSWTLMLLNSSLNPVVYCWKMRNVRQVIMDLLRDIKRRYRKTKNTNQRGGYQVFIKTIQCHFSVPI